MINPVAFTIFGFKIYWYGVIFASSLILGIQILKYQINQHGDQICINSDELELFAIYVIAGVLFGARIGNFLFFHSTIFTTELFYVHHGGMSFHGSALGVVIAITIFCNFYKKNIQNLCDFTCLSVPSGLFLGRIANHINQEFLGTYSTFFQCYHPIALYESFLEGFILFIILHYKNNLKIKLYNTSNALIYYGTFRFLIEYFKICVKLYGINISQILCLIMVIVGIIIKLFFQHPHSHIQEK